MIIDKVVAEFEWDEGNKDKPKKHGVTIGEAEEAFFDDNKVVFSDWIHSAKEKRFTLFLLLIYKKGERKIKLEISKRLNSQKIPHYKIKYASYFAVKTPFNHFNQSGSD